MELRQGKLGVRFRRQHPVGRFVADFACVERKLIVELDGPVHERLPERALGDVERTRELEARGWHVVRFANDAVAADMSGVLDLIARELGRRDL